MSKKLILLVLNLFRTTFLSSVSSVIKILSSFIAGKITAVIVGPSGLAYLGSFNNILSILNSLSNGAISSGVVKYSSEYQEDSKQLDRLIITSLKIAFLSSLFFSFIILSYSFEISEQVFNTELNQDVILLIGFSVVFFSLNSILVSIINGLHKIKLLTIINIISSISSLLITVIGVYLFNFRGALFSVIFSQILSCFIAILVVKKYRLFSLRNFYSVFDFVFFKKLSGYGLMTIVTALSVQLTQFLLRNQIIRFSGIEQAGFWQAATKISEGYLLVLTSTFSVYYLPKFSSIKLDVEIKRELFFGLRFIVPLSILLAVVIFLFKSNIIILLFSSSFKSVDSFIIWQLIGDVFKMSSWLFAYLMLAKSMIKEFIFFEIMFSVIYWVIGTYLIQIFGAVAISIAYSLSYGFYFLGMLFVFRNLIFNKIK